MGKTVVFRMNGVGNAFLQEMGCRCCPQCSASKPRANTSASLIVKSDSTAQRQIENHVLFDFGFGVAESLIGFGVQQVDYLFNSHDHLDHIAGIDKLIMSQLRTRPRSPDASTGAAAAVRPVLYSTDETWRKGVAWRFHYLKGNVTWRSINGNVRGRSPIVPGEGLGIHLKVTPLPVYHGRFANEPVVFVVEFGQGGQHRKLALCWDLLHLVTEHPQPSGVGETPVGSYVPIDNPTSPGSYGYPTDDYPTETRARGQYDGLAYPAEPLGEGELLKEHEVLRQPDELFIAGNTLTPQPQTGHASITSALQFISRVKPRRAWIVHYSGHEDPCGPLSDGELQRWLDREKVRYGLAETSILVAEHGMVLSYG